MARNYRHDYILRRNEMLFEWQFGSLPSEPEDHYHLILALYHDDLAACLGYIPVEVNLAGELHSGAWTANWMVEPEFRRLGLGPILMRELMNRFDVTLVVGLSGDARDLLPRMGWTDFGELDRYVCVLDVEAAKKLTEPNELRWPPAAISERPKVDDAMQVKRVERFCIETTSLWENVWGRKASGTHRSASYLNWRYADHPMFEYRLFEGYQKDRLCGFAVYHIESVRDHPVKIGRLVELVAEADCLGGLLCVVIEDCRANNVALVDFFCSAAKLATVLLEHGFLPGDQEPARQIPVLFQPVDRRRVGIPFMAHLAKLPGNRNFSEWYVTKSDGDQDRPN